MIRSNSVPNEPNAESAQSVKRTPILVAESSGSSMGLSQSGSEKSPIQKEESKSAPSAANAKPSLFDFLCFPVNKEGGKHYAEIATNAKKVRPAFTASLQEREIGRIAKNGRELSELEILQEKHEPEFKQLVPAVSEALTVLLARQPKQTQTDHYFKPYETSADPTLLLEDYVQRLAEYTYISPSTMLISVIFIDRLCRRYPTLVISPRNIFKLFFVSLRVASKSNDLRSLNNKNFANVGGVSLRHLNELETKFILDLRFGLYVDPPEFMRYAERVKTPAPHRVIPRPLPQHGSIVASRLSAAISQDQNIADKNTSPLPTDSPSRGTRE